MNHFKHLPGHAMTFTGFLILLGLATSCSHPDGVHEPGIQKTWQETFEQDLNLLGHRNWILVADKAFPEQSSAGMKYIYVDQELLPTLQYVLERVESSTHVSPVIYRDKELSYLTEDQVPGISAFRSGSEKILDGRQVSAMLHDEVFGMLDESSSLFRVLVIKTNGTLPYTSVFIRLDCAYWNPEQEGALREKMSGG